MALNSKEHKDKIKVVYSPNKLVIAALVKHLALNYYNITPKS